MKKAFTLAEVLITLGVIGVVSAITMPTLIQNQQEKVLINQLKVANSMDQWICGLMIIPKVLFILLTIGQILKNILFHT